jgi:ABC-type phosphate transport system substrate-binding protein
VVGAVLLLAIAAGAESIAAAATSADYQVIVHPTNALTAVDRAFLADAFLKKASHWPDGEALAPVDQRPDSGVRKAFSLDVLKRSVGAVRSYWTQRIFSGRDIPPPELDSDAKVVQFVASRPGAVGYVGAGTDTKGTKPLVLR